METTDKQFFLTFSAVTAALILIAVVVWVAANFWGAKEKPASQAQLQRAEERIKPVGNISLASNPSAPAPSATPAQAAEVKAPASGDQVYALACQACHAAGLAGAPAYGDKAAWAARAGAGIGVLYESAIKGKGAMPAKGGITSLSDQEVKAAVDYIMEAVR